MDYRAYRKRSSRLIDWWLFNECDGKKKEFWYIYLLLEKATVNLRADPISVAHDLWEAHLLNIEDVENMIKDSYKFERVVGKATTRQKYVIESHMEAIKKAVEIHKNLSDFNRSLIKELGYY